MCVTPAEFRKSNIEQSRAHFQSAIKHSPQMYEAHYNYAVLAESKGLSQRVCGGTDGGAGDYQSCFSEASASAAVFEQHVDSRNILAELRQMFNML